MTAIADSRTVPGAPAEPPPAEWPVDEPLVLDTRFGRIEVERNRLLEIPCGLLGFDGYHRFALTPIPDKRLDRFLLLQSVEDLSLAFIVVALAPDAGMVDPEDVQEICATAGTDVRDALLALIVTVRKGGSGIEMTANVRAPVVVDTRRMIARQCVFANSRYSIRHAL